MYSFICFYPVCILLVHLFWENYTYTHFFTHPKQAVEEAGGPMIPWRAGRSDADDGTKTVPDGRLPDATQGAAHLRDMFYRMGFNDKDIVALSGAHSMGKFLNVC